ncbi:MAG: DNA polymerase I, partial [Alkaliphilus sp.]|nr:DNA polymerase I [Alkaliphilus sp.]
MENPKIIIIDGNSLINRAFYALPLLSTKEGIYTNAVYGFTNMLYKIIEDYGPNYITVAFDRKAPTFRHVEYDAYKAGRKKMPEELAQQFPILKEVLEALRIHKIEIDGFEADDLIGTLVEHSENKGFNSIVVTGDKDALQLASNMTKILITKKGISSLDVYDTNEIIEKLGITPDQIIDLKGLMGDKSDNIPGVPGIGEKTALKLITEFKSIENILNNLDKVPNKKMREKLEEHASQALLSKRLATIVKDVPVEIDFEELRYKQPDYQRLVSIFNKLEFHSLLRKI